MKDNKFSALENLITIAIILVVIHTFLEDFATVINWNSDIRTVLMIVGFGFDLFFTIEFLARMGAAFQRKRVGEYFIYEKGWIDFLASVPLLMLNSAPPFVALVLGGTAAAGVGGILNMLKLIKAIRIARILRLLRVLKVFRKIKYADSKMAQRHVSKIITIAITSLVFTLLVLSMLTEGLDLTGARLARDQQKSSILDIIDNSRNSRQNRELVLTSIETLQEINNVLIVKLNNETIYSRYASQQYYDENFGYDDYVYARIENSGLEVFYDTRAENALQERTQAKDSLIFFFIVLVLVIAYLVVYSPHFALTVTDPIYVMRRGLDEADYTLTVKVPERYAGDDVYLLARLFNENYLPLKVRNQTNEEEPSSDLSLDDYQDLMTDFEDE